MGRANWAKPETGAEPNLFIDQYGRWTINAKIGGRKVEKVIGPKHLARKYLTKLKEEARLRKLFPEEYDSRVTNTLTVAQICARFRKADEIANVDHAGHASMERVWIEKLGEDLRWHEVSIETVTAQQVIWLDEGMSPARVNRYTSRLHKIFTQAVDARIIRFNPIAGYQELQEPSARTRKLSFLEQDLLMPAMLEWAWEVVEFALLSGMRQSEQFKSKITWIHLESNEIHIPDMKTPKGIRKGRILPMSKALRALVIKLLERAKGCEGNWLFPNRSKTNADRPNNFINRYFQVALDLVGIIGLTWHDLRRTCGSRLHLAGAPIAVVQAYLGHSNSATTDRYISVAPEELSTFVKLQDGWKPGDAIPQEALEKLVTLQDLPRVGDLDADETFESVWD